MTIAWLCKGKHGDENFEFEAVRYNQYLSLLDFYVDLNIKDRDSTAADECQSGNIDPLEDDGQLVVGSFVFDADNSYYDPLLKDALDEANIDYNPLRYDYCERHGF